MWKQPTFRITKFDFRVVVPLSSKPLSDFTEIINACTLFQYTNAVDLLEVLGAARQASHTTSDIVYI